MLNARPQEYGKQFSHSETLPVITVLFLESHRLLFNVSLNKNVSDITLEKAYLQTL